MADTDVVKMLEGLSDHALDELQMVLIPRERQRRQAELQHDQAVTEVVAELWESGQATAPDAVFNPAPDTAMEDIPVWVNPGTIHTAMYRLGAVVRHSGRVWRSEVAGLNSWEPGAPGVHSNVWLDVTADFSAPAEPDNPIEPVLPPVFVQPTGAHDAYKQGDRVTYQDSVWESLINGNVWAPDVYPRGWRKIE